MNHVGNIKIFAMKEKELETLMNAIRMELGVEKCAMLKIKKKKR